MQLRTAFNRPAFTTRLEIENSGDDMLVALADTRAAITLGILVDRQGRRIGRVTLGLEQIDGVARSALDACVRLLDQATQTYNAGISSHAIVNKGAWIRPETRDGPQIVRDVDRFRGLALEKLNEALATEGLAPLDNYLLVQ